MAERIQVHDPRARGRATAVSLAPLKAPLAGARVGFLDNNKHNAAALLGTIRDRLVAEYGVQPVWRQKPVSSVPVDPVSLRELARCEVVITGSAD